MATEKSEAHEMASQFIEDEDLESGSSGSHDPLLSTLEPNGGLEIKDEGFLEIPHTQEKSFSNFGLGCSGRGFGCKSVYAIGSILLPSFLKRSSGPKPKLHPTSWLDGLRGVASFCVFIHHFILGWFPDLSRGYASAEDQHYFFQLPFIRLIYSGRGMVTIFFVISGYVLSYSALKKIRSRQATKVLDSLSSSVFRRWMRLNLPLIASTFITVILLRLGWLNDAYDNHATFLPATLPTLWEQIVEWWSFFIRISDPFTCIDGETVHATPYGSQLWTIPREFRGSIVVYATLLGFAKTTSTFRVLSVIAFSLYACYITQWDIYLFLSGMALAEIQLIYDEAVQNGNPFPFIERIPAGIKRHGKAIYYSAIASAMLLAIHFLTIPDQGLDSTPGYGWMLAITPSQYGSENLTQRFWLCLGAPLLGLAMIFSPATRANPTPILQRPFNTAFAQYLGNISYALYVIHLHIIWSISYELFLSAKDKGPGDLWLKFAEATVINNILVFWISDLFWRGVDMKSVAFAKWVAGKAFVS